MFENLKTRTKIIVVLSSIAIVAVGINGYVGNDTASASLKVESFGKLTPIRASRGVATPGGVR